VLGKGKEFPSAYLDFLPMILLEQMIQFCYHPEGRILLVDRRDETETPLSVPSVR
jgi:hypothetical protein